MTKAELSLDPSLVSLTITENYLSYYGYIFIIYGGNFQMGGGPEKYPGTINQLIKLLNRKLSV